MPVFRMPVFRTTSALKAGAAAAAFAIGLAAAPVDAQYYGDPYGYSSPYRDAYGYDGYSEPPGYARPAPSRRQSYAPQSYAPSPGGYGYDQGADGRYVEPADGGRGGGRYDLGPNGARSTREVVANTTRQPPGTIVIDTASRELYYTQVNGQALRYGIGVGREGFAWHGTAKVERKAEWPSWTPPSDMVRRRPDLPARMEGGIENPLGARALYLFQGNRDTLFRIHGTNEPDTIGQAVSSGCIRMMNADVIDLYSRVPVGTRVVVL